MHAIRRSVGLLALLSMPRTVAAQGTPVTAATIPVDAPAPSSVPDPAEQTSSVEAAFGRGVTVRTDDRRFSLTLRGRIQMRFTLSEQPERPQTEFQIRRMRLVFQGNFLGDDLRYYIQLAFSNLDTEDDLRLPLRDAYGIWQGVRDLNVRFGQMKVPYGRQRVTSSSALQFVDRALSVGEFNLDRDVGVILFSRDLFGLGRRLTYELGVFGGDGRNRLSTDFGLLHAIRVQVQPFGDFDDLVEADLQRLDRPRLAIALSAAYNQRSRRARSTFGATYQQPFDQYHLGADLLFKWRGFSLQTELLYRQADEALHDLGIDAMGQRRFEHARSGVGYYVQAGYLFTPHVELGGRWGEVIPAQESTPVLQRARELGAVLSGYFLRHDFKLQADYFYLAGEDFTRGRHQARIQAQIQF